MKSKFNKLIHIPTGRLFAWHEKLAKRQDMKPYVEPEKPKKSQKELPPVEAETEAVEAEQVAEPDMASMAGAVFGRKKASKE